MGKEIVLSLKEEPVELFRAEDFQKLIEYAKTNQSNLNTYWQNKSESDIQLFLKYAASKLYFFEEFVRSGDQTFSVFEIGKLLGAVESYGKILYEKTLDRLAVKRVYEDGYPVEYLDEIVALLESKGSVLHTELFEFLLQETSSPAEVIDGVLKTGIIDFRSAGKYKVYSLTEDGIRYGKYLRNQESNVISDSAGVKEASVTTIKEICETFNITQTQLSRRFDIPLRTVQGWHAGDRTPPAYVVKMMAEILRSES